MNKPKKPFYIICLFIIALVMIISSAAFWNVVATGTVLIVGSFEVIISIINFILELAMIIFFAHKVSKLE